MSDTLVGTVKGPGEKPNEFVFITTDNDHTRVGEFIYYSASAARAERKILGNITERRLVRALPDSFLADPATPPAAIAAMIGLEDEGAELFEILVSVIGYYDEELGDFVNPRIPPMPGQSVYLAPSELLARVLSPQTRRRARRGAHRQPADARSRRSARRAFGQRCCLDSSGRARFDGRGQKLHGVRVDRRIDAAGESLGGSRR